MADTVPFGAPFYLVMLALLLFARGSDLLSTWVATPTLALEGNPIVKKLGWKWGILLNIAVCVYLATFPFVAITVATTSVLVAARNFQSAWLMRSLGEGDYRLWYVARIREARLPVYLFCMAGQTLLVVLVGAGLMYSTRRPAPQAIGLGIIAYAVAIAFYSLLSVWRTRRGSGYTPQKFVDAHTDVK